MTDFSPVLHYRYTLILLIMTLLLLLQGCTQSTPLQHDDIADRLWLRTSSEIEGPEGFFTGADSQLLLFNALAMDGLYWELKDDRLLLWFKTDNQSALQPVAYRPLLIEKKLFLSPDQSPELPAYAAEPLQEPLSNVHYFPTYLRDLADTSSGREDREAYLQLDTGDKSLRGYGGVNNFYGSYQRKGVADFKTGSINSTMMVGPGMDYETKFMNCFDQADKILAISKRLFFYQGSHLLCSFGAD